MYNFPIGVILESFKLDRSEAIKKAAKMLAGQHTNHIIASMIRVP